jgi:hypothetical protein
VPVFCSSIYTQLVSSDLLTVLPRDQLLEDPGQPLCPKLVTLSEISLGTRVPV